MPTTIQVSDATKQLLDHLKKQGQAKTYDQIIMRLVKKHSRVPESMFGAVKGLKWQKEDRMGFDEL